MKYSLSTREIKRAEPNGFYEGSGYISPYILPLVIIQTFSITKKVTIDFPRAQAIFHYISLLL